MSWLRRGFCVGLGMAALSVSFIDSAHAVTGRLNKEATGRAIAVTCESSKRQFGAIGEVYQELNPDSPAARWKAFVDELIREQTKFEGALKKIRPEPAVDGGITAELITIVHAELSYLVSARTLLKKGRVFDALDRLEAMNAKWVPVEQALVVKMQPYGYQCAYLRPPDRSAEPASASPAPLMPVDPKYLPTIPGFTFSPAPIEQAGIDSQSRFFKDYYSGVEVRNVVAPDGKKVALVTVYVFNPLVASNPRVATTLADKASSFIGGVRIDPIAGFDVAVGSVSFVDALMAIRSDVIYEFQGPVTPNQADLRQVASLVLAAAPTLAR